MEVASAFILTRFIDVVILHVIARKLKPIESEGVYVGLRCIAVFGTGTYLRRLLFAHFYGVPPLAGAFFGYVTQASETGQQSHEITYAFLMTIIMLAPISFGAQLPFWFLRIFWGWQLVSKGNELERSFQPRDIFTITFVCALAFAAPGIGSNLSTNFADSFLDPKPIQATEVITQPDGTVVPAPGQDHKTIDRGLEVTQFRNALLKSSISLMAGFAILSLLSMPVFMACLYPSKDPQGCGFVFGYYAVLVFITAGLMSFFWRGIAFLSVLFFALVLGLTSLVIAVPAIDAHSAGWSLVSPKRARKLAAKQLNSKTVT